MEHYNLKRMIMKKSIILLAMVLGAFTANAQSVVEGTKLTDNWSVEVNAGAITPLTHSAFFKNARPGFGIGVSKQLTPIFGLEWDILILLQVKRLLMLQTLVCWVK